jgi:hypothetical protein
MAIDFNVLIGGAAGRGAPSCALAKTLCAGAAVLFVRS